jgi:chromosome segregation ATPase
MLDSIKKLLTETVGADEATKVVESLTKWEAKVKADAEIGIKAKIEEGIKEAKVKLETEYLTKLEEAKTTGDKAIKEEMVKYEKLLAERVKLLLTQAVDAHGDRLAKIAEETAVKRGSKLLEEVTKVTEAARAEIAEQNKVKPEDLAALKKENEALKEEVKAAKKQVLEHKARANVAESEIKSLRESLEGSIEVLVEDTEPTKAKPAAEENPNSQNRQPVNEDARKPSHTPEMARMRRLAGLKTG